MDSLFLGFSISILYLCCQQLSETMENEAMSKWSGLLNMRKKYILHCFSKSKAGRVFLRTMLIPLTLVVTQ